MKGQVSIVEAITVSIVLILAFNVLISTGNYQSKWNDAIYSLSGKDTLVTIDRIGKLNNYAFNQTDFRINFLLKAESTRDTIVKIDVQGTLKEKILVACNCTTDQIAYLQNSMVDVKLNNRKVNVDVCPTNLVNVSSCSSTQTIPDVLVIWGYRDFGSNIATLANLINHGVGIVEIADIQSSQVDVAQQRIFGLVWNNQGNYPSPANPDSPSKPGYSSKPTYVSYKLFYHLPYTLTANTIGGVPIEKNIQACTNAALTNNFMFQGTNHQFWICGTSSVYFDTDGNGKADMIVTPGNTFSIGQSNFKLNYLEDNSKIRISFKRDYKFNDFVSFNNNYNKLSPIDGDTQKVFVASGFWDHANTIPISVSIFNSTGNARVAWIADFSRNGLANTGDDHKLLISSIVLSASNKISESSGNGQISSYINSVDNDMFEVYRIDLKFIKPF
ncbi:MAG: hypothetical protein HYW22_01570 [Candidatus Aenigmarchaeota archaeon]|nr:hypothetical protein [Candidatus Aenigmarchaeota archaeon]